MRERQINLLMHEANIELDNFFVGEYFVLRTDEEGAGRYSRSNVYAPISYIDAGLYSFREVFWNKGYYADRSIGKVKRDIVCLCKVIDIKKAEYFNGMWDLPHLIIENVATHQTFDFAKITHGRYSITTNSISHAGVSYDAPIMPYLLTTHNTIGKHFFSKVKTTIEHYPTFVGVGLEKVTNSEIVVHLEHIAKIKQREIKQQQELELQRQQEESITQNTLQELYRKLDY